MGNCIKSQSKAAKSKEQGTSKHQQNLRMMSIFRAQSFLEQQHGKENIADFQDQVVKKFSDASTALRKAYKPMNQCLGEGSFGAVYLFTSRTDISREYAVKILIKDQLDQETIALARDEIAILAMLDHPNIVKYVESYEDERYMYIVMEYIKNATELTDVIIKQKKLLSKDQSKNNDSLFPEDEIRRLMYMILGGLHHIHSNRVIHRDLKPENVIIDSDFRIKIIDFGLSKMASKAELGGFILGTPEYLAPEVYEKKGRSDAYTSCLDCWAAGVIMFFLICGRLPFAGNNDAELEEEIRHEDPMRGTNFARWSNISDDAKDLIKKLLEKSPAFRITAEESLQHEFFKPIREQKLNQLRGQQLNEDIFRQLTGYRGISQLKKAALSLLVKDTIDGQAKNDEGQSELQGQIEQLRQMFQRLDLDGSGLINADELAQAMKSMNIGAADGEIDKIIREIDYVGNGKINYTEFLSATLEIKDTLTEEMLWRLFKKFDVDDTGFISKENLVEAFKRLGRSKLTLTDISEMIYAHDIAKDGQISF